MIKFEITETNTRWVDGHYLSGALPACEGLTKEDGRYYKTFDTLEDLMAFAQKNGSLMVLNLDGDGGHPELEIYNAYRE